MTFSRWFAFEKGHSSRRFVELGSWSWNLDLAGSDCPVAAPPSSNALVFSLLEERSLKSMRVRCQLQRTVTPTTAMASMIYLTDFFD